MTKKAKWWTGFAVLVASCGGIAGQQLLDSERGPVDKLVERLVSSKGACVKDMALGLRNTCALLNTGKVHCFGEGPSGDRHISMWQLGDPPIHNGLYPAESPEPFVAVAAGYGHSCAVAKRDGAIWCWGRSWTELDDKLRLPSRQRLFGQGNVEVVSGNTKVCAIDSKGEVRCADRLKDDMEVVATGVSKVAMGFDHGCLLKKAGGVQCWGDNYRVSCTPFCGHPTKRHNARGVSDGIRKEEAKTTSV